MKSGVNCCMMVCLAVKQLMFYVRERVLDNLFNHFIYNFFEFITINKLLRKVFFIVNRLKEIFSQGFITR